MPQDRQQALEPSGTAQLGAEMRAARQRMGWGIAELAASLRIRAQYLEAIEDGRVADLPGTTYALGFIRAYGNALGLPGVEYATRFRAEGGPVHKRPELAFPAPVPQRGVPAGAVVLLGLLVVAVAYGGWYYHSADQRTPSHAVPALPERLAPLAAGGAAAPPSPQVASILPSVAPPSQPAPAAALPAAPAGSVASPAAAPAPTAAQPAPSARLVAAGTAGNAPVAAPVAVGATPPAAPVAAQPPASGSASGSASGPAIGIVVKATAESWVMVRSGGKVLLNRTMHAGDAWPLPAGVTGATLTTGNAGGTVVVVDGADTPSLGASGAVRRDVALDSAGLRGQPASAPADAPAAVKAPPRTAADRLNDAELHRSHAGATAGPD